MKVLDDLDELKTFTLVVELGSLSAAARLMQLTTNAVSRRVIRLEQNLGVKVLRRSTRAVSVTAEGRVLYAHARRALEELKAAEDAIKSGLNSLQGSIRVALPGGACSPGILAGISDFLEANPDLRLEMLVVNTPVDPIGGGFDVVIHAGPPKDSRLTARRLHSVSWALAAAPRYLAARRKPRTPSDLSEHVCLRMVSNPPQNEWRLIDAKGNVETVHVAGNFEADDSRVLADATYAGLGIGVRPEKELAAAVARAAALSLCQQGGLCADVQRHIAPGAGSDFSGLLWRFTTAGSLSPSAGAGCRPPERPDPTPHPDCDPVGEGFDALTEALGL